MKQTNRWNKVLLYTGILCLGVITIPDVAGQSLLASITIDSLAIPEIQKFIKTGKLIAIADDVGMVIDESENNQFKLFPAYPDFKYAFFVQLPGGDYESYVLCEIGPEATLVIAEKTSRTQVEIDNIVEYIHSNNETTNTIFNTPRIGLEIIGGAAGFAFSGLFMYMVPELGTGPAMLWLGVSSVMTSYPVYYLGNSRDKKGSFTQTFMGTAFAACTFYAIMNFQDWQVDRENRYLSDPDYPTYWAPVSVLMIGSSVISFNRSLKSQTGGGSPSIRPVGGLNTEIHFPSMIEMNLFAKPGKRSFLIPILSLQFN
ncbi:MAG: hypothetical protein H8E26_12195 [FCB group bacterium]|nr:hypothetical protein [FCB group bacterium]